MGSIAPSLNANSRFSLLSTASAQPLQTNFLSNNFVAKNADVRQEVRVPEPGVTVGLFVLGVFGAGLTLKRRVR